jgi:hypothetical protein
MVTRYCLPLPEKFFCDGPYYVLTSTSLGGSSLTPESLAEMLRTGEETTMDSLLAKGLCLPLFFPGDCAFDGAILVLGELTPDEEAEWIGRIQSKLHIPCGQLLLVCGGGSSEDWLGAMGGEGLQGYRDYFQTIDIPAGDYLVEVLAYVSSMSVDFHWEAENGDALADWFYQTRPGEVLPPWITTFQESGFIGELSDELVTYLLHLTPLVTAPPLPVLDSEMGWCGEFEWRRPIACPRGIPRSQYSA